MSTQRLDQLRTALLHVKAKSMGDIADYIDGVLDLDDADADAESETYEGAYIAGQQVVAERLRRLANEFQALTVPISNGEDAGERARLTASIENDWKPWIKEALDNNTLLRAALRHVQQKLDDISGDSWEETTYEARQYIKSVLDQAVDRGDTSGTSSRTA